MWNLQLLLVLLLNNEISAALSFNQPKFSSTATWNPNATTFANQSIVGSKPFGIFINPNNTIYVANYEKSQIIVWNEDSANPTMIINGSFIDPLSLFVTSNGDIYIDDGAVNRRVVKWISTTEEFETVMNVASSCDGLFVDIMDNLYCSMWDDHRVVKRSLNDSAMTPILVAGTGNPGSDSNQLSGPDGIFVDVNLDLYVADYDNHRIQLFQPGQSNGVTVAGNQSPNPTILLAYPTGVVLDAEKYLFIVDFGNHRIVGSGLNGFRCLVGCDGVGSQSNQLYDPVTLSFDRFGNMFVTDRENHRIQKFLLMNNSSAFPFNQPKFCPTASWNPNGVTFAGRSIVDTEPVGIFINTNNTIYVANRNTTQIIVWNKDSVNPTKIINDSFLQPQSLFVTSNGDIYIDDGFTNGRVVKWISTTEEFETVMNVNSSCFGLFVDIMDSLYCSMGEEHRVMKISLNDSAMTLSIVAGTGIEGFDSKQLSYPVGIFVHVNLDLYVADCRNDRVQLFQSGQSNGVEVAGSQSLKPTISLDFPTGIVLDADKYLFIVDSYNHRIVGSGLNGFRCLVGCNGQGSQSNQLSDPLTLSFDGFGNLFVTDRDNHRIQKFQYLDKSCIYSLLKIQQIYASSLTTNNQIYIRDCLKEYYYYASIQVKVNQSGYYSFQSYSPIEIYGSLYTNTFNPVAPSQNLFKTDHHDGFSTQFRLDVELDIDKTYVLVVTTLIVPRQIGVFSIVILGNNNVILDRLDTPINIQWNYSSELTSMGPTYYRDCKLPNYHYDILEINVNRTGLYVIWSESQMNTYGYIYKNEFTPLKPLQNLLAEHDGSCNQKQFKLSLELETNTRYILVVTTFHPTIIGKFSVIVSGPDNVSLHHFNPRDGDCVVGDQCNFYIKSIGLTLDDILRGELRFNTTFSKQSFSIKLSAALTIVMFIVGSINSILSFITFKSKDSQQVGCGIYLLASSVTSFLAISMFTIKFWFVVLTQINLSTSLSVLRGGCISIETILKLFLYLDGWLNACVAVERAIHISKGVHFNKAKSKRVAREIIRHLPFYILGTLTHELLYRNLFEFETGSDEIDVNKTVTTDEYGYNKIKGNGKGRNAWCVTGYSPSVQDYNTAVLLFHLLGPFIVNLLSALFIIFGTARQRSVTRTDKSFAKHAREQFNEHKQLIISPVVVTPRLVISLLPGCVKTSESVWLYLSAYFISFIPSMLIFLFFVVPSQLYMKIFKQSFSTCRRHTRL